MRFKVALVLLVLWLLGVSGVYDIGDLDNSLLLLAGTAAAVTWANLDVHSYDRIAHPLHFVVNDIGMVFFFALAAKEVFEATLPGGALASPRRAFSPLAGRRRH